MGAKGKSAKEFFRKLQDAGVRRVVDVRLKNESQIIGFARKRDLPYFLLAIAGIDYVHDTELAPTEALFQGYRAGHVSWQEYERQFVQTLHDRTPEKSLSRRGLDNACLLCSEAQPDQCHRRLVAEHLQRRWKGVKIQHL
jgi:uncharacterized protein (DUF488 family)